MNTTMKTTERTAALGAVTAMALAAMAPIPASGADWYVAPTGAGSGTSPSDRGDLMSVLYNGQVASGDNIHLAAGTYNLDKSKSPYPSYGSGVYLVPQVSGVTFVGETGNPEDVRLVGTSATDGMRIFYFFPSLGGHVIRNLTISGGYTDYQGAGICMANAFVGNPEAAFCASNCVVENCSAAYQGGGVFGGLLRDCVIRTNEVRNKKNNELEGSGGGVFHAVLHDCVITNNVAGFCGGGIAGGRQNGYMDQPECPTRAYNCLIGWNRSTYGGGAGTNPKYCTREYCQLFGCTLVENTGAYTDPGDGGGLGGGAYQCIVSNCVVRGNESTRPGGSSFNAYGHSYNSGVGGGVMDCEVVDSVIEGNSSYNGGAGAACSSLTECIILDNVGSWTGTAFSYGGGAYFCSLTNCLLAGNSAGYGGGAFYGDLENCVISNNTTTAYDGGAAYNANTRHCIVVGNRSNRYYALCKGTHYGDLVFANSNGNRTHANQQCSNDAIAIGTDSDVPPVAVNCTVWWNTNGSADISRTVLTNCIVQSVGDIPSAVKSFWVYENGTVENRTDCISGTDKDPKFEGLGVSEPVTSATLPEAFALKPGSPCRDKGLLLAGQTGERDLLGTPRVKYEGVDMGALESRGGVPFTMVIR